MSEKSWMDNFTLGGRNIVPALLVIGELLVAINEVVLYWVNYYLEQD